jgi:hypothetical protein
MSTSPEDEIVNLLSRWLARHVDNEDLRRRLDELGTAGLSPEQVEAIDELREELARAGPGARGGLEVAVRETLEAVALGT